MKNKKIKKKTKRKIEDL